MNGPRRVEHWRRAVADVFYPRSCSACGSRAGEEFRYLCWECAAAATLLQPPMCSRCGEPVAGRVDGAFVCHLCSGAERHFELARSAARYDGPVRELIRRFKYEGGVWVRGDLVTLLSACVETHFDHGPPDAVVPVPLHPVKRRERGYNQAEILAAGLARRMDLPVERAGLRRVRFTATQTHLTAHQRADNVRGAFQVRLPRRLRNRHLLLVDDVMTTGATVSECSRCLLDGGAAKVWVVTVARG